MFSVRILLASQASKILKIERKTINGRYNYLREVLVGRQIKEKNTIFDGVIEIDESYFGAKDKIGEVVSKQLDNLR